MKTMILAAAAALAFAVPASADTNTVVTNINSPSPLPAGTNWSTIPDENTGTAQITATAPRSGNGSIELTGDRTRVQTGYQYGNAAAGTSNMGSLDDVQSLTYDWQVAGDSTRQDYTPALRLLVQDGTTRSELIWEGVYQPALANGSGGATFTADQWYSTDANALFWQFVAGSGANETGGHLQLMTVADWAASTFFSSNAFVSGISVGAGSGATAGYHAFADNVAFSTTQGTTTYNFELAATGAVPEASTWAMMLIGFGAVGFGMRKGNQRKLRMQAA